MFRAYHVTLLLVSILYFQLTLCQYDYYEYEEDDEYAEDVAVSTTSKKPTSNSFDNMNFTDQFKVVSGNGVNSTNSTTKSVSTLAPTTTVKTTTTTSTSRPIGVGWGVHGILKNVMRLDIPGIVDNAIGIGDSDSIDEVRKLVAGIMNTFFCLPVLNNFSSCKIHNFTATAVVPSRRPKPRITTTPTSTSTPKTASTEKAPEIKVTEISNSSPERNEVDSPKPVTSRGKLITTVSTPPSNSSSPKTT